jgi:hypothetical protein
MAEANVSLSPKARERIRILRCAIRTIAIYKAKGEVKRALQARGEKVSHYSACEITLLAEAEFKHNGARLIADATAMVTSWPEFRGLMPA